MQRDPANGLPGVLAIYQLGNDANPGLDANGDQLGATRSRASSVELYEPLFAGNAMFGVRDEHTDDGLGNVMHFDNLDLTFGLPHYPYLHGYIETGLGANSASPDGHPDWRWTIWWTVPTGR